MPHSTNSKQSKGINLPLVSFVSETKTELNKVTWPTRKQVVRMSALVIIASLVTGLYLGLLDYIFVELVKILINR